MRGKRDFRLDRFSFSIIVGYRYLPVAHHSWYCWLLLLLAGGAAGAAGAAGASAAAAVRQASLTAKSVCDVEAWVL